MERYQRDQGSQGLPIVYHLVAALKCHAIQIVYLSSMSLFIVGSVVVATSKTISLVIGMRVLQAMGWVHIHARIPSPY